MVVAFKDTMQGGGTLLGRGFTVGKRYSSWPERIVVLTVFCSALLFFGEIDSVIVSAIGADSDFLTAIFLIILIPIVSDLIFRTISLLLGIR
ncbi:MAG: hypothetical protein CMA71_02285 [Euryarchaeota archaeon]|jgi:hypothetical protein|nr:hypothetical protein [Euryarchaeota archaeon]DAC43898.1 MAG TPA: hypothetical protein D7H72_02640 [Candidatus Poseidoniales archaeon]|tara:strand:+ start:13661 stop:13936 length:276 start_codon:yes stop_codon:yes gene_type:complete